MELGTVGMAAFFTVLIAAMLRAAFRGGGINAAMLAGSAGFLLLCASDNALATPAYFPLLIVTMLRPPHFAPEEMAGFAFRFKKVAV